jgi:hypothetical protein
MLATGRVQESESGQTSVLDPAAPGAFSSAPAGSIYVEFDVDPACLRPGGRKGWSTIVGPRSLHARLEAARTGVGVTVMPLAMNIEIIA